MKKILPILFFAIAFLIGCSENKLENLNVRSGSANTFQATFEQAADNYNTKTFLEDGRHLCWTQDDRVSLFLLTTLNIEGKYCGQTGDNGGNISTISVPGTFEVEMLQTNYAVYPYHEENRIDADGVMTIDLPAVQHYANSSFGLGANTMVAVTKDNNDTMLQFKNLCGYLVVKVYGGEKVASIELKGNNGEKISGKAKVQTEYGTNPSVSMTHESTSSIILDCGEGVTVGKTAETATEFWFCVPPMTFSKGFTITLKCTNHRKIEKSVTTSKTISRNKIYTMSDIEFVPIPNPEFVDLGLSVKWASFNLGASKPEEYGDYFQWAGNTTVINTDVDVNWSICPFHIGADEITGWTKYVASDKTSYWSGKGSPDNKTVLDLEDDVAHLLLGKQWRIPTHEEYEELRQDCIWEWTELNGVKGYKVTSTKTDYADKWIFLPSAGYRSDNKLYSVGIGGYFWSSSVYATNPNFAYCFQFKSDRCDNQADLRLYGYTVRPVSK